MSKIINAIEAKNVGDLIKALKQFPTDMAIDVDVESTVAVCQVKPVKGEYYRDKRGYVKLLGISEI